ncbi:Uncharacterized protein Rs2_18377 [Raphanus sativus]|nr:Uncharacterized protein Rs2_18377 [Raphanus sativus]
MGVDFYLCNKEHNQRRDKQNTACNAYSLSGKTPSSSKLLHAQKIEPLTISELISLTNILSHLSLRSLSFFVLPNSLVFRQIKDGVILVARNVHRSFSEIFLLSLASSLINQTLWVSSAKLTSIQVAKAAQILGDAQIHVDDMPGENPVASNGPDGADNIVAELASGVVAEG